MTRRAGWRRGSPRCTPAYQDAAGDRRCRTGTTTGRGHLSPTTASTRSTNPGPGMPDRTASRCSAATEIAGPAAPIPQRRALAQRAHPHRTRCGRGRDPRDPARGFWEVTTCAVVDWPCQTPAGRARRRGRAAVHRLHDGRPRQPLAPRSLAAGADLAALHRELAANMPVRRGGFRPAGNAADRNVELRMAAPFPLGRLAGI